MNTTCDDASDRAKGADTASTDSPKRHGDKLGVAAGASGGPATTGRDAAAGRDSPKPHGDELAHAVEEAAKR